MEKKEAFSDGVSSKEDSWYVTIQDKADKEITQSDMKTLEAPTKEAAYFKKIFIDKFGKNRLDVIPHYWLPKWNSIWTHLQGS